MRFHVGLSINAKKILKLILPLIIGLFAYFGISNLNVLAFENPSNCSDSSITDFMTCNIQGYYEIKENDITSNCNIYLGDSSTLNWRTRQVAVQIDYDVKASEINTTYDSNELIMQQTSRENNGQVQSNFAFRFKRLSHDSPLYLSLTTHNLTSEACQYVYGAPTCPPPNIHIYYCSDDTFNSCYHSSYGEGQAYSNELNGDIRFTTYKNLLIKSNSQIKSQYNTSVDYPYVQINFPNMLNSDNMQAPPINSGWVYSGVLLSAHELGSDESPTDNEHIVNYCPNTGGDYVNTGGNSVLEDITNAINNTLTGPEGVLTDPTLPNITYAMFDDLLYENSGLASLMLFPLNVLQVVSLNYDTCTPLQIDLSPITTRWGGERYVLTIPCIRDKVKSLIGTTWYDLFDTLIAGLLFYYFSMNLILKVNDLLSGYDNLPYFYESSKRGRTTRPSNVGKYDKTTGEVID